MGAGEIDSLEIQVQATAQKANQSLDALVGKLDRLTASLGKINGNSIISLSNGVQRLATSMQSMKSVGTADFTRLAKNISKMGEIDATSLSRSAASVHQFSNALSKLDTVKVSDNAAQIGQLANGIKQLGYSSATKAIENIPKLATAMKQLMTTLSGAPKVSRNLIDMTNALAKLARTGASSGRAANSLGRSLDTYTASTGRASKGTHGLASALGKLYATYWLVFRAFRKIGDAINISSNLTEVQNVVDVTFGNMSRKVEEFAKTSIEQFGMSELSLKQYASRFQAMGSAMDISKGLVSGANKFLNEQTRGYVGLSNSMADVSLNLTKLTADMASFYNVEQKDVAEDLASIFTGQTRPLRTYGLDLSQATLKEWALKNGLDADIKSMSQAEKTMLRYQYVMANTGAAQGDFARTADTWANQVRILKQNFEKLASVIGGTFIQALKPLVSALNAAMSHIIAFAETVSNALGKIFGWKYESGGAGITNDLEDAEDSAGGIASGIGDAADNAKKLKNNLLAIDELNVLNPDEGKSSGSGSGSGGASSGSSGSGGQWVKQDSIFDDYKSSIDSLYGLGEYIGQTLTNELNGINWDSVYQGAKNFGKGLANFLNGLISPELFGATGRTIASALNTAIYAALSFGETFDFYDFGVSIATGINNFFETFDFGSLAKTLNTWVDGLEDSIAGFLKTVKWSDILKKAGTFLGDLELDTIAVIIGALLLKNRSGKLLGGAWLASQIATKLGISSGSLALYTGLAITIGIVTCRFANNARGWIDSLKKWWKETSVGSKSIGYDENGNQIEIHFSLKATIDRLFTEMSEKAKKDWSNFGQTLKDFFTAKSKYNQVFDDDQKTTSGSSGKTQSASSYPEGYAKDLIELEKNKGSMPSSEYEAQKKQIQDAMKSATPEVEIESGTDWTEIGRNIVKGIKNGIQLELLATNPGALIFDAFVTGICNAFGIHSPAKNMEPYGKNILLGVVKGFSDSVSEFATAISDWWENSVRPWFTKEKWQELGENAKSAILGKFDSMDREWKTKISNWWKNDVSAWFQEKDWNTLADVINGNITLSGAVSQWQIDISGWWDNHVSPWFTQEKWQGVSDTISNNVNLSDSISQWKTDVSTWWKENVSPWFEDKKWSDMLKTIPDSFKSAFKDAANGAIEMLNNVIGGVESMINRAVTGLNSMIESINKIPGVSISKLSTVSLPKIPQFAVGGFPEDGLFMANHTELVGQFSNGKTAVANNEMIVAGIEEAAYRGFARAYAENNREADLLQELIYAVREGKEITIDGRSLVKAYDTRKARNGFSFT